MRDINSEIQNLIDANPVIVFMKGTPKLPMCGFSGLVCQILGKLDVTFEGINILEDAEMRQGIKDFSNWPTIPQLYIKGEFIGGSDIARDMYESGELQEMLKGL